MGPKLETVVSNRLRVLSRACGVLSCWGHLWLLCSHQQHRTFFPSFRFPCFPSSLSPPSPPFSHRHSVCSAVLCLVAQPCPPLCDPMDCRPPGSSAHGDSPASILEHAAMPASRGSSQPRDSIPVSHVAGGFFCCCCLLSEPPGKPLKWAASDTIVFISVRTNGVYLRISMSLLTFRTHKTQLFQVS